MAISNQQSDNPSGTPILYLLFAGRHDQPRGSTGSIVAAYRSRDEARAAFRSARLGMSDLEGWAELAMVAEGRKARQVSWFGQGRPRRDKPPTWPEAPRRTATDGDRPTANSPARQHRSHSWVSFVTAPRRPKVDPPTCVGGSADADDCKPGGLLARYVGAGGAAGR